MKNVLVALFVFSIITLIFSCQKEVEETLVSQTQHDTIFPSRIISLDTDYVSGEDTTLITSFSYDPQKRLQQVITSHFRTGMTMPASRVDKIEYAYSYTGTQTHPSVVIRKTTDYLSLQVYTDTLYLTYGSNYLTRDSVPYGQDYDVDEIIPLSQARRYLIRSKSYNHTSGILTIDTSYSQVTWSSGNLLSEVDSSWSASSGTWNVYTSTMSYDTHANSFLKYVIPLPNPMFRDYIDFGFNQFAPNTVNNIKHQSDNFGTLGFNYTYTAAGFPDTARITFGGKSIYEYIRL